MGEVARQKHPVVQFRDPLAKKYGAVAVEGKITDQDHRLCKITEYGRGEASEGRRGRILGKSRPVTAVSLTAL
jgi:hypothetical protein